MCEEKEKALTVGDRVPDFELETFDPAAVKFGHFRLADAVKDKRWTVLVFYPADFTFVCPTELADLACKHRELAGLGAEVVSVSIDTKFTHMGWQGQERLLKDVKYPMGSDVKGTLAKALGTYDYKSGLAYRGTFIINPEGVLVGSEVNFSNVGRDMDELVRKMKAFAHVYKNPQEVCPAKWKPGERTLKPSEKLVGKVHEELK
ncbi:MAG: peroxiredoxin (alkyl hydroperoxide reductase subunit C) [Elusimicrobia bacterium]|nr:MAG: peroxiredoxin (alkyl hydroperoxide reductase subunit C) [Elusimicrobiota bacterium]KAF0156480.1 MAG: peroxiredoxin (alkyl hydroperoxide reductase subunit C) [Elusimicrobiota bacterium]